MKTPKLILSAFLAVLAGSATAQTGKISLGAQAGPSLMKLRGNEVISEMHQGALGYSAGLTFQYSFTENIALHTGISYDQKGSLVKGKATDANGNNLGEFRQVTSFDYLAVPVLVRATFGEKIRYFLNGGIYGGYLTRIHITDRKSDATVFAPVDPDNFKDLDFGVTAGVGALFPLSERLFLSAEIRDNLGLANISRVKVVNNGAIKTNAANLLIGVNWNI